MYGVDLVGRTCATVRIPHPGEDDRSRQLAARRVIGHGGNLFGKDEQALLSVYVEVLGIANLVLDDAVGLSRPCDEMKKTKHMMGEEVTNGEHHGLTDVVTKRDKFLTGLACLPLPRAPLAVDKRGPGDRRAGQDDKVLNICAHLEVESSCILKAGNLMRGCCRSGPDSSQTLDRGSATGIEAAISVGVLVTKTNLHGDNIFRGIFFSLLPLEKAVRETRVFFCGSDGETGPRPA
ncbi:hypothetical protein B0H34DRAFT_675682 [Crassisporium funariophilum]|nr:hypothetical protein B0H34DRAFT_675682 [Crassisporium funariophilum]